jgi:hypothetical protein
LQCAVILQRVAETREFFRSREPIVVATHPLTLGDKARHPWWRCDPIELGFTTQSMVLNVSMMLLHHKIQICVQR